MNPPVTNVLQSVAPVVAYFVQALAGSPWMDALRKACVAGLLASFLRLLLGQSRREPVLVDCRRNPAHSFHQLAAFLFALTTLIVLGLGEGDGKDPVL